MRVLLLDPAAFTLPYDHHLARALAARGVDVELVTSRFRFGDAPEPEGYRRRELFYPASSRLFRRSPLRLPLRAAEHVAGLTRLRGLPRDVLHVQWAPLPQVDVRLLPAGRPSVITAHDILPRRTQTRTDLWRRLYGRFDRVVVHSEDGRGRLVEEVGVREEAIRVIPHPVFPGVPRYEDDGATLLFFGLIRPYKQIDHALAVAERLGARLLVLGDPTFELGERLRRPGVEWRLGYQPDEEIARGERRTLDCVDCHNRPSHTFAFSAERAVDEAITAGALDRSLPFVRREAVRALRTPYTTKQAALDGIGASLTAYYREHHPGAPAAAVTRAVETSRRLYLRNVFPSMQVGWGTYVNNIGHTAFPGCFRCHDDQHVSAAGKVISQDCSLCHTME